MPAGVAPHVVAVHRRQLPIVHDCEGFAPAPGSADEGGFCERCQRQVHDVSIMREAELRRLLAAHAGGTVCLTYRTDARGRVRLRPEPVRTSVAGPTSEARQPLAVGALALLLAACAGHAGELEVPGKTCRDADGYAVTCPEWSEPEMLSVPEADEALAARDPGTEGCPVRPTATEPVDDPSDTVDLGTEPSSDPPDVPSPGEPTAASDDAPTSAKARVNFSVDPNEERIFLGVVVVSQNGWIERDFVPTAELWKQWRERRAERKAARLRWRAARRETVSR